MEIDEYDTWEEAEAENHFANTPEDSASPLKGRVFRGWTGLDYVCTGHFPCGYHMHPITEGAVRRRCISERAIGRSYHEKRTP